MALVCLGSSQEWSEVNLRLSAVFDGLFMVNTCLESIDRKG